MVKAISWLIGSIIFTFLALAILWKISTLIAVILVAGIFLLPVGIYITSKVNSAIGGLGHETNAKTRTEWDS